MAAGPVQALDELIDERLGRHWDIRRQQDGEVITYLLSSRAGEEIELGQAHGVHLWLSLPQGWRSDTHGDDVASLVYDFNSYIDVAEAVLRGQLTVPQRGPGPHSRRWKVPDLDVIMR